jgi:hypothetical protein
MPATLGQLPRLGTGGSAGLYGCDWKKVVANPAR